MPGLWETGLWETPPCGPPAGAALARLALRLDFGSQFPLCGLDPHQSQTRRRVMLAYMKPADVPDFLEGEGPGPGGVVAAGAMQPLLT